MATLTPAEAILLRARGQEQHVQNHSSLATYQDDMQAAIRAVDPVIGHAYSAFGVSCKRIARPSIALGSPLRAFDSAAPDRPA